MLKRENDSVLRVALDLAVGAKKARMSKEDLEEASRGGDSEDCSNDKDCPSRAVWSNGV